MPGAVGPSAAYYGTYNGSTFYYCNASLVSLVFYGGNYYIANNPAKNNLNTWGAPGGTDWTLIGATFQAIATGLLLSQNVVATVAITVGVAGMATGIVQSANYVAGVSGFYMDGTGFAQFNNVEITGSISTTSTKFNLANTANTMPAVGTGRWDVVGPIADASIPVTPSLLWVTDGTVLMYGWNSPSCAPGFNAMRFGSSTVNLIAIFQSYCANASSSNQALHVQLGYRTRSNGGAWNAWTIVGIDTRIFPTATANAQSILSVVPMTISGLGSTDDIELGVALSKDGGAGTAVPVPSGELLWTFYN